MKKILKIKKQLIFLICLFSLLFINQSANSQNIFFYGTQTVVEINKPFTSPDGIIQATLLQVSYYLTWSTSGTLPIYPLNVYFNGTTVVQNNRFTPQFQYNNKVTFSGVVSSNGTHCDGFTIHFYLYLDNGQLIAEGSHTIKGSSIPNSTYSNQRLGVDLIMRDGPFDKGKEPNYDLDPSKPIWANLFMSPDLWVRRTTDNIEEHQNPDYPTILGHINQVYTKIWNIGCTASTYGDAYLHLYWTRARTGEKWNSNWLNYISNSTVAGNNRVEVPLFSGIYKPLGGEITISDYNDYSSSSQPIEIPQIAPGTFYTMYPVAWQVPNPIWYDITDGTMKDGHPAICLLARIVSTSAVDYMKWEPTPDVNIQDYVQKNNNAVTRNTFLTDDANYIIGTVGRNWKTGWATVGVYVAEPTTVNLIIKNVSEVQEGDILDFATYQIGMDSSLLAAWDNNDGTVTGANLTETGVFEVTDPDNIVFNGIPLDTGHVYNIGFQFLYNAENLDGKEHIFNYAVTHQIIEIGDTSYGSATVIRAVVPIESPIPEILPIINSIHTENNESNFAVYPNPYNNGFKIQLNVDHETIFSANLYSIIGELVKPCFENEKLKKGINWFNVSTGDLKPGVFFLKIKTVQGESNIRIVKQ